MPDRAKESVKAKGGATCGRCRKPPPATRKRTSAEIKLPYARDIKCYWHFAGYTALPIVVEMKQTMVLAVAIAAAAVAYPNGWTGSCNRQGTTVPTAPPFPGVKVPAHSAFFSCTGINCTLSTSAPYFRGFVISSTATPLVPSDSAAKAFDSAHCLTHSSNADKSSILFKLSVPERTTLHALVVTGVAGLHQYIVADPHEVNPEPVTQIYVVGAGPGGLAAARYAAAQGIAVTVFEQGPEQGPEFWNRPIKDTGYPTIIQNASLAFNPLKNNGIPTLVKMVGGQQLVNGAVFSPGAPSDLAESVGVALDEATAAQAIAASYVNTVPAVVYDKSANFTKLMHRCTSSTPCENYWLANYNQDVNVKRAAIAYELPSTIDVQPLNEVESVSDTLITFTAATNRAAIAIGPTDRVILAAGALVSPQLVGNTSFCGYNHYYTTDVIAPPITPSLGTQLFKYPNGDAYELNYGLLNQGMDLEINLTMLPSEKECYDVGQSWSPLPIGDDHAWHFMGTVKHTLMRAFHFKRVYVGDASALSTPFNCHTSAPAAAAGVLAVKSATAGLSAPTPDVSGQTATNVTTPKVPLFFLGVLAIVVAILCHPYPSVKSVHYWLAPLGVLLITVAAALPAEPNSPMKATEAGRRHRVAGWWVLGLLWLQVSLGVAAKYRKDLSAPAWFGKLHRVVGWLLLISIIVLASLLLVTPKTLKMYAGNVRSMAIAAISLVALALALSTYKTFEAWFPADADPPEVPLIL